MVHDIEYDDDMEIELSIQAIENESTEVDDATLY